MVWTLSLWCGHGWSGNFRIEWTSINPHDGEAPSAPNDFSFQPGQPDSLGAWLCPRHRHDPASECRTERVKQVSGAVGRDGSDDVSPTQPSCACIIGVVSAELS